MSNNTIETVQSLLADAIERTDDPEVHFTLRQAAQLLLVVQEETDDCGGCGGCGESRPLQAAAEPP
ncbi:hypothetical protein [Halobellus sp. GM3]|uniref:hypothetical protein n=1 Tax=Halobellus sp. GM3 TaxID=3458410 RepID=UPI00403DBC58